MMEESFSQLPMPVAFLRPGWFMENHAGDVNSAISEGIIYSYLQPIEHAIPMIATKDSRVTERIRVFLQSDAELFDALSRAQESPRSIQPLLAAAKKLAQKCFSAHAQGSRQLLRASLRNVLIYDDRIEILLGSTELRQNTQRQSEEPAKSPADPEDGICLTVPAKRMRRDGAVHLIIPASASMPTQNSRPALIKAVARGRAWYDQIIAGHLPDLKSLARKTGLTAYYVKNVLSCAFLAPDIVEAILDGQSTTDPEIPGSL
jgi:hypothetical protein